jgi:transcriptional regulator with GAF, ATPase, and Fis domain/predicted Ser/Thr protein kinase
LRQFVSSHRDISRSDTLTPPPFVLRRFEGRETLGPGVVRARDVLGGPDVIVKRASEPAAREALRREADTLVALRLRVGAPDARWVLGVSEHGDELAVVLEDVQGRPLDHARARSPERARAIATALLRSLLALHELGLAHGDLKPSHVLVDDDDRVRLLDLGLATPLGASARGGTAGFLAPELLEGGPTSARSELFAFARTLSEAGLGGLDRDLDALIEASSRAAAHARPPSFEAALASLGALPRAAERAHAGHDDPLAPAITELEAAIIRDEGSIVAVSIPPRGGRTHLTRTLAARAVGLRLRGAERTRELACAGARDLLGGLAGLGPLLDAPHTEDRERLVERACRGAIDRGLVCVIDGADDASPDLRADLAIAARTLAASGRGCLVLVGLDAALEASLAGVRRVRVEVPPVDSAELARALTARALELAPEDRALVLSRTEQRRGLVHAVIDALDRRGPGALRDALARAGVARANDARDRAEVAPLPTRLSRAREAAARDAPRAVLEELSRSDRGDEVARLRAWALSRTSALAEALASLDTIPHGARTHLDRARRARWLERTGALEAALEEARAVAVDERAPPEPRALALVVAASSAYASGRLEDASALVARARALDDLDRVSRVRIENVAADLALAGGGPSEARRIAEHARSLAEGDRGLLALVEARLGAIAGLSGDPTRALSHHEAALAHAEAAGDVSALPPYVTNVATAHHLLGDVARAIASYERAATLAERLGRDASLATTLVNLAALHQTLRADEEAAEILARADRVAERAGAALVRAQSELVRAELAKERGAFEAAGEGAGRARETFSKLGARRQELEAAVLGCEISVAKGAREVRLDAHDDALEAAGLTARAGVLRASVALAAGRASEASVLAESALERAARDHQPEAELRASILLVRAHASLGTGAAEAHELAFRRRLGELAARTPAGLRERLVRRWSEALGTPTRSATQADTPPASPERGLGPVGARLVSLVRRTLLENDEARLLEAALDEAIAATAAERGFLLLSREGKRAEVAVARNLDRDTIKQPRFRLSRSVADRVLGSNEPLVTASATEDPELAGSRSILDLGLRSIVCVPVRSPSGVRGALYLDHRFERGRFDAAVAEIAQGFADVVGLALENSRLHRASEARLREAEQLRAAAEERASAHLVEADRMAALLASEDRRARRDAPGGIVGEAPAIRAAIELVRKVARTDLSLCIEGESGTGKELFARLAHDTSPRRDGPFLAINCGALPEQLLESELFGHVRGAFTGATRDHAGLLRSASGGTVFLDEVGEMPASMQVRLLRALQEKEVRPVGGRSTVPIDVRVVTATHRHLEQEVERGRFRRDLYFRLAGVTVQLPPLRERASDIPLLVQTILDELGAHEGRHGRKLSRRALAALLAHPFPGNVRELEQALRRAWAIAEGDVIEAEDLGLAPTERRVASERVALTSRRVAQALSDADGNRTHAARALGVSRATLHRFLAEHPPASAGRRGRPRA